MNYQAILEAVEGKLKAEVRFYENLFLDSQDKVFAQEINCRESVLCFIEELRRIYESR